MTSSKSNLNLPIVSVVIPTFNCANFICRAVDSILDQELSQFEIIIINDASTDNTLDVLKDHYGENKSIKIINHEINLKLGAARNTGLDVAKGKYVFFLDADDWLEKDSILNLISIAEKNNAEIVACGMRKIWNDGKKETYHAHKFSCKGGSEALKHFVKYEIGSVACNKLYLRQFIEENELRFIAGYWHEDVMFTAKAVYVCNKYFSINDEWYNYFQRDKSIVNSVPTQLHLESYIKLYVNMIQFIQENNLNSDKNGVELSLKLIRAHCSDSIYPNLVRYANSRSKLEWESELICACKKTLGVTGLALADFLILSLADRFESKKKIGYIFPTAYKKYFKLFLNSKLRQPVRKIRYFLRGKKI